MKKTALSLILSLIFFSGCKKQDADSPPPTPNTSTAQVTQTARPILAEPITPVTVETPAMALTAWRACREVRPTLVLFANHPFLQLLPEEMKNEIVGLVDDGEAQELTERATSLAADPVLLPPMTVRAALEADYFSGLVWVFPSAVEKDALSIEVFTRQMLEAGVINEKEAKSFVLKSGVFTGKVADHPIMAVHPEALPTLNEPIVLHLDLSFFQPFYKGEIKTPLYSLMLEILNGLKTTGWNALTVSISFSNIEGGVPLASRFVGRDLAAVFATPTLLGEWPTIQMQRRANALYLENFFKNDEIRQLYIEMETIDPLDASVKYALYDVARQFKEGDKAMQYLQQAADLDRIYALEYLTLADLALEKRLPGKAIEMLQLARTKMPENPFIPLSLARTALNAGQHDLAAELLQDLLAQPWSSVYYPGLTSEIQNLAHLAQTASP